VLTCNGCTTEVTDVKFDVDFEKEIKTPIIIKST